MSVKASTSIMRSTLTAFVSILLVASLIPVYALAEPADDADAPMTAQATLPASGISGGCTWEIDADGNLVVRPTDGVSGELDDASPWYRYKNEIVTATFSHGIKAYSDASGMFNFCPRLLSVDFSGLDTSEVTDMSYMLEECPSLVSLDLSSFDTSSVTDMRSMFYNCSSLKMLDLSGFDTSKVMDMGVMFAHCSSLVSLDLSSFDTSSVTDMTCMFNSCSSLATLDLSGFETITVIDMNDMFSGCSSLTSLSLVSFDVSSVVDMSYMFYMCSSLDTLDLSGFDTTSVINMKEMFSDCPKLGEVKLGDKFDFRGAKTEPQTELPGEVWLSTSTGEMFTSLQIAEKRNRIADTYLLNGDGLISIANASIASIPSQLYTGAELRPEIAVTLGSAKLTEGRDYSVTYEGNVNAGTAKVTVTGMNGFVDTLVSTFEITPLSITSVELSQDSFTYDGSEKKPAVIVKSGDRILVEGPDYEVQWPADVTAAGVKAIGVTGKGNYAGNKEVSYEIAVFETRAMFRLYNPNSGEHFYTSSDIERDHLISLGWQDEGIGWTAPVSGDAVYRLYNSYAGEHHYTLSADERDMLVSVGWNDEGIGWYSDADRSVPLYRVYNPNEFANNHHYTTSEVERDFLLSIGWRDEGVGWHGVG